MKTNETFIKLSYEHADFYFSQSMVTSGSYASEGMNKINLDDILKKSFTEDGEQKQENIFDIRRKGIKSYNTILIKTKPQFLLLTSKQKTVETLNLKDLRAVTGILKDYYVNMGFIAFCFNSGRLGIIVDADKFHDYFALRESPKI